MFLSLNRKIIYSILILFLISSLVFVITFYIAYLSKIEKDQQLSIQRNQQYADLLYRNASLTREIRLLLQQYPDINFNTDDYQSLKALAYDKTQSEFIVNEQKAVIERSKSFDEQYRTINAGVTIIACGGILLSLFIIFLGFLINRWILIPINKMSQISEEISRGNLQLRIPLAADGKYPDELDNLAKTFNMMLDNLQSTLSKIRDRENFLQSLIDNIPDGIRVIDENYRIIIANRSYYKQVGTEAGRHGLCYEDSFNSKHPCDSSHTHCPLHEILHRGKHHINIIQQFYRKPECHMAVNAAPLIGSGPHKYIIESIRDLSDDIDFSHQQKLSSLGFLSSSIAHEIKNQLGALRMILEHFIGKYYTATTDDNEQKKMINLLHTELVKAIDVPERLLKLTRNYTAEETEINTTTGINDVLSILDFEAKSKGIDINFHKPDKDCCLIGNESDFRIAVINIILNAIKATPAKGHIDITIEYTGNRFKISFADTGCGISKDDLPYIFNPFFSEGHQKRDGRGSGLGLAITKSIIEKMGGSVTAVSTLGKGSCFTLTFPQNTDKSANHAKRANKKLAKKNFRGYKATKNKSVKGT